MPASFRIKVLERDLSGFVTTQANEIGAMVINSVRGREDKPIFCQSEQDVILHYGNPSASKYGTFEAINFCRVSPAWLVSAIGANATYAGVDVQNSALSGFGTRTGRSSYTGIDYSDISENEPAHNLGTGDGITDTFSGTLTNTPITESSLIIKVGGTTKSITDSGGSLSGIDVDTGSITYASGAISIDFSGSAGTKAKYTTKEDLTGGVDLSTVATAGTASISSTPTTFVGSTVPAIPDATYDLDVTIDGGSNNQLAIALLATDDWDGIATKIQSALQTATGSTETVVISSGKILITSATTGSSSAVLIAAGTAGSGGGDLLTAINTLAGYTPSLSTPVAGKNAGISITIDDGSATDIDLGNSGTTTRASILAAINAALGGTVASNNDSGGEFLDIEGLIASATYGSVTIDDPTTAYVSAFTTIIDDTASAPVTEETASTDPTGAIPKYGQTVTVDYIYAMDETNIISHSFFAASPYNDTDYQLAMEIQNVSGTSQYTYAIYEVTADGNSEVESGTYSLNREQDAFGKSLYIEDIFDDNAYVIPVINEDYSASTATPASGIVNFTGGSRGDTPQSSDYSTAWAHFEKVNRYSAKIFMDIYGNSVSTLENLLKNFQLYSFGITIVPLGNDAADAVTYRSGLGVDFDKMSLCTNWEKISDTYNNSVAWTSGIGKVGVKYAQMEDVYDGLSPAGVDENGHGGQMSGFTVLEMEYDYTATELQNLDNAQINPKVFDEAYGPIIMGDRTLKVTNSDTSFVGTRRLYNLIIDNVIKQVLRKQEFKLNDAFHRTQAKTLIDNLINPILVEGLLAEALVVCDESNNTPVVLDARKFVVDMYVRVTPNSQLVTLRFTRLSQVQSIAEFV